jgi:hypothetical protein
LTSKKRIHHAKENEISAMIDPYTNCFSLVLSFKPNLALTLMRELARRGKVVFESLKATLESLMMCSNLEALTTGGGAFSVRDFSAGVLNKFAEIEREAHFLLTLFRKCGLVVFVLWKG